MHISFRTSKGIVALIACLGLFSCKKRADNPDDSGAELRTLTGIDKVQLDNLRKRFRNAEPLTPGYADIPNKSSWNCVEYDVWEKNRREVRFQLGFTKNSSGRALYSMETAGKTGSAEVGQYRTYNDLISMSGVDVKDFGIPWAYRAAAAYRIEKASQIMLIELSMRDTNDASEYPPLSEALVKGLMREQVDKYIECKKVQ